MLPVRFVFILRISPPPRSPLFPYTTLFRSRAGEPMASAAGRAHTSRWRRQPQRRRRPVPRDRKSTRLNSSHVEISYAVFCLKKKKHKKYIITPSKVEGRARVA